MAVHLRAVFVPGIRVIGCIPCLGRGHGRQGTQRLIVLPYVLAGTDLPSADRPVNVLEPKALIRAPTMRSAKLDLAEARTGKSPGSSKHRFPPHAKLHSPLPHSQFRSTDCPSLQDHQPTSSISEHSECIYQSIHQSTSFHEQSRSGKATPSCDPTATLATP